MRRYPTREGIVVPLYELELPQSNIDRLETQNVNNHHMEFTRKSFGRFLITRTLRELYDLQTDLPLDVHAWLHKNYAPPEFPSPQQAMARLAQAYFSDEPLQRKASKGYAKREFTPDLWQRLNEEYEEIK